MSQTNWSLTYPMKAFLQSLGFYQIKELSTTHLNRIAAYQHKWSEIATSSKPMDRLRLEQAIAIFYRENGLKIPEIRLCSGPQSVQELDNAQPPAQAIAEQIQRFRAEEIQSQAKDFHGLTIVIVTYLIPVFVAPYLWVTALYPHRSMEVFFAIWMALGLLKKLGKQLSQLESAVPRFLSSWVVTPLFALYTYVGAPALLSVYLWPTHPTQAMVVGGCYALLTLYGLSLILRPTRAAQSLQMPWAPSASLIERQVRIRLSREVLEAVEQAFRPMQMPQQEDYQLNETAFHLLARSYEMFFNHSEGAVLASHLFWFSRMDFCISELRCKPNPQLWEAMKIIMEECGWILPLEKVCWVCERPREIHRTREGQIHYLGGPAIAFADQSSLYAHQGVELPEQYGKLLPEQWQSSWILTEPNAEVRRQLIAAIGYERLCAEQEATVLDRWREYELLRFAHNMRLPNNELARLPPQEPITVLKMTCPSTQHVHVIRVPPQYEKARDAARWINWDTDPESFAVET